MVLKYLTKVYIAAFLAFLISESAFGLASETMNARHSSPRRHCVVELRAPPIKRVIGVGPCQLTEPLKLTRDWHNYPKMNRFFLVHFWDGAVGRVVTVQKMVRHTEIDTCSGNVVRTRSVPFTSSFLERFNVRNPNLNNDIATSYDLAPLTESEAQAELASTFQICQHAPPPVL